MRFLHHIMLRVIISLSIVLGVWAVLFYCTIVEEVNDETDDVLEDYSAMIIQNFLVGESMPQRGDGSNNSFSLRELAEDSVVVVQSRQGFTNEDIFVSYKGENEPARVSRQVFCDDEDRYFELTVLTPTIDNADLIEAIWQALLLLFALLLIVILVINSLAIRGGLRPLHQLLRWLHKSDIESCELPDMEQGKIREINELKSAVELFAQRGRRAFEQQKEFLGNASHELQTPIAVCQNRLELLLESELTEEQMQEVGACLSTLARLSKLNRSLLMLSKIENGGFENSHVDVNQLIHRNLDMLHDIYEHRNITLTIQENVQCSVDANSDLVATLVLNLLKNSYSHNVDGGEIRLKIATDSITISNSGGAEPLDEQKIFSRFYQGSTKSGTCGLGLPIVYSICKLHGFGVRYYFKDSLHNFEIKFK